MTFTPSVDPTRVFVSHRDRFVLAYGLNSQIRCTAQVQGGP
jgi:hypothetical protein